jgi:hypothetical protein
LISCPTLTVSAPGRSVRVTFVGRGAFSAAGAGFFLLAAFFCADLGLAPASASFAACAPTGASNNAHAATNKQANRITSTSGRLGNSEHVA